MARVLVLFHSWTGGTHLLAEAVADGARTVDGVEVDLKQVPECVSDEVLERARALEPRKKFAHIPEATIEELPDYDGFAFGTPTRFGNMTTTMRNFLDQTGGYYARGTLIGKPATVFCSTGTGGGSETTITSFWNTLAHLSMTIVPLGSRAPESRDLSVAHGGSPYGASIMSRAESETAFELDHAIGRAQGRGLAEVALKLSQ
jgi:NAD(P)H dehydrogenase (quinone)